MKDKDRSFNGPWGHPAGTAVGHKTNVYRQHRKARAGVHRESFLITRPGLGLWYSTVRVTGAHMLEKLGCRMSIQHMLSHVRIGDEP